MSSADGAEGTIAGDPRKGPRSEMAQTSLRQRRRRNWRMRLGALLVGSAVAGWAISCVVPRRYVAVTTIATPKATSSTLPPDASSVLASDIYAAVGLGGNASQYVGLMHSVSIVDHLIDEFGLMGVYQVQWREEARKKLESRSDIDGSRTDGLIRIGVSDSDPARAAGLANAYVRQLSELLRVVAMTEARQRQAFFSGLADQAQVQFEQRRAQIGAAGIDAGVTRASALRAATGYAQARARVLSEQATLDALRLSHAESSPEVQHQSAMVGALEEQLAHIAAGDLGPDDGGYVSRYRELVYQQTVLALLKRQQDAATLDVANEGPGIRTIDAALPPQHAAWPHRGEFILGSILIVEFSALAVLLGVHAWRTRRPDATV
jgi:hypothetical protein